MRTGSFSFCRREGNFLLCSVVFAICCVIFVRFFHLGGIRAFIFDEVYYVPDAWSLRNLGYEAQWQTKDALVRGSADAYDPKSAAFVVHPRLENGLSLLGCGFWPAEPIWLAVFGSFMRMSLVVGVYVCCRLLFGTDVGKRAGLLRFFDRI